MKSKTKKFFSFLKTSIIKTWKSFKIWCGYNKHKITVLFALLGMITLTAFPQVHYAHWYEVDGKYSYNALAMFIVMLLSAVQMVNSLSTTGKKPLKSKLIFSILYTFINVLVIVLAYFYISPYFLTSTGFKSSYWLAITIVVIGIVFLVAGNVTTFIFLKHGEKEKQRLSQLIFELQQDVKIEVVDTSDEK